MTDKALNEAIARKLGWKDIPPIPSREHLFEGYMLKPDAKSESDIEKVPDFCGSMDDVRTAIKSLTDCQFALFVEEMRFGYRREGNKVSKGFEQWVFQEAKPSHFARAVAGTLILLPVAGKEVEG